jgi:hypothetical protein
MFRRRQPTKNAFEPDSLVSEAELNQILEGAR